MKNTKYLVRLNQPQRDKDNTYIDSWDDALKKINKTEKDIDKKVEWLNYVDYFFIGLEGYIREIKN